jgi:hypothetical protein
MLENYEVATQLVASQAVRSSIEFSLFSYKDLSSGIQHHAAC